MKVGDLVESHGELAIIVSVAPSVINLNLECFNLRLRFLEETKPNPLIFSSLFVTNLGECPDLLKELCETD